MLTFNLKKQWFDKIKDTAIAICKMMYYNYLCKEPISDEQAGKIKELIKIADKKTYNMIIEWESLKG